MVEKRNLWNEAGKAGIALGCISIAYMAASMLTQGVGTHPGTFVMILMKVLWAIKFGGCIYLMKFFIKKFAASNPEADNTDTFKFGAAAALLSALLYAGFYLAWASFIQPDMLRDAVYLAMENMSSMIPESKMEEVENIIPMLPTYAFFTQLCYCALFGTMLSAIFSRNIPSTNPFSKD